MTPPIASRLLDVAAGYAAWAPLYDHDGNPLIMVEGPAMRAWIETLDAGVAVELGCGTGRHTAALAAGANRVIAIDFSPAMLAQALKKGLPANVALVRHSILEPLPLGRGSIDAVVMPLVADHVEAIEPVFREVARVLKPGGSLLVSVLHPDRTAAGETARFIDPETGRRQPIATYHHSRSEYQSAAAAAGLELIEERTLTVLPEHARVSERAGRYLGEKLGWQVRWRMP